MALVALKEEEESTELAPWMSHRMVPYLCHDGGQRSSPEVPCYVLALIEL